MLHCTHRNPSVPDFFDSEYMIRDAVVHEADITRFLLAEEIISVSVIKGAATAAAPMGTNDPMMVIFETESGCIVTDEIYVRTAVAYEVRTEVVGERGSAMIGLDANMVTRRRPTVVGAAGSPRASSNASGRPTTPSCIVGSTPRNEAPSTGREPGTATPP